MKRTIEYKGMVFHFKCRFADGAYYETGDRQFYLLTDSFGNVEFCSSIPLGACQSE